MKRRIFKILSGVALLLCVASAGLSVRCSSRFEVYVWRGSRWDIGLLASGHEMALSIDFFPAPIPTGYRAPSHFTVPSVIDLQKAVPHFIGGAGIGVGYGDYGGRDHQFKVFLPLWLVVTAALGLAVYFRHRAKRWVRLPGLCPSCGYDLRVTPGRCPECGAVPAGAGK